MNKHFHRCQSFVPIAVLMVISVSCNPLFTQQVTPTAIPSPTPQKVELINGELDPCQLIKLIEVEPNVDMKVMIEGEFRESSWWCLYRSIADEDVLFGIIVTTNATIIKGNQPWMKEYNSDEFSSAVELYEGQRKLYPMSKVWNTEDIENLGDQAFLRKTIDGVSLDIHVLNNDIYYRFYTGPVSGVSQDALMKLAKIAEQRMP